MSKIDKELIKDERLLQLVKQHFKKISDARYQPKLRPEESHLTREKFEKIYRKIRKDCLKNLMKNSIKIIAQKSQVFSQK